MRQTARRIAGLTLALAAGITALGLAHDMFLKPDRYFVPPGTEVLVRLLNGTFSTSENGIERSRLADVSVVSPAGRETIDTTRWDASRDTSFLTIRTGEPGTYVIGTSTRPSLIELAAADFNTYLEDDGIPDELAARRRNGELDRPAKERYSKHVKALVQVGDLRTDGYRTALGYPAEIVPLENPYTLNADGRLRVRVLVNGAPVANQLVLSGGRTPSGGRLPARSVRSDSLGVATVRLSSPGTWYVKFINMRRLTGDPENVTHESRWATLTFAVR